MTTQLLNYINGSWTRSAVSNYLDVINPATAQALAAVPLSPGAEVGAAAEKAAAAFVE